MFDRIVNTLSGSAWTYLIVAVVSAMDAIFPVVPADAAIITAAVLAAQGSLSIVLVVGAGLVGATAGDNVSYYLGARLGSRAARRLFRGATARARLDWARDQVGRRGVTLVVAARFIPVVGRRRLLRRAPSTSVGAASSSPTSWGRSDGRPSPR